jgi:hypothetical protein
MAIEQAVYEMQIAGSATTGADGKLSGQMRFGTRGESRRLFMPHMDPFNLALAPKRVGQPVQTIADNAIDTLDACRGKCLRELVSDGFDHITFPWPGVKHPALVSSAGISNIRPLSTRFSQKL